MRIPKTLLSALALVALTSACNSTDSRPEGKSAAPQRDYSAPCESPRAGLAATATMDAPAKVESSNSFTPTVEREVKLAKDEPLSTFAADVDTGSYTYCRRKLREGALPQADAVRPEEFLNYFDYGDTPPGPNDEAPFSVTSELTESPFGDEGKHFLRIGIKGRELRADQRKAMHLTFLVDVSGSMQSADKLNLVKTSLKILLGNLQPTDTVALCTYAGRVAEILGPTPVSRKGHILEALEALSAGGSTAMESGLQLAYKLAARHFQRGAVNRVIVCSDGDANVGNTDHESVLKTIEGYVKEGITLSTLGFGDGNYKDVTMEQLADKGNGNYSYIDTPEQARRVFGPELLGTLQVIAKDLKIQVEFAEAVESYRLVGYENRDLANEDFRKDEVDAGELGAGHRVTAVYELTLCKSGKDLAGELGIVRLRAKEPEGSEAREWSTRLSATPTRFESSSPRIRVALAALGLAEVLRGSKHATPWSLESAEMAARTGRIPNEDDRKELLELIRKAAELQRARS